MKLPPIAVLFFDNARVRAGVEEHILTLLRGLDRQHFRLFFACAPELAEKMRADVPGDVELVPLYLEEAHDCAGAWQLAQVLRRRRIDLLHSHLFQASRLASVIGRLCGVPRIVETPHVREQWRQRKGWLKRSFVVDRLVGRFVDCFIAVSEAQRRYLAEEKHLPYEKIVVIRNGADLRRFHPARRASAERKKSLGVQDGDPVIVMLARLEPQKGHDVLLDALPQVRNEFPRVRVLCVGEGSLRPQLVERSRQLGLEDCVRFVGYQSDPVEWLALADFTVLPSYYEGLPIAAIESLAMAKTMVATDVDGTAELVLDGKTGLTVPPGQPSRLAQAICRLLREPELRQKLGEAGREWVSQHYSQEQQIRKTEEFYSRALGR